MTTLLYSVETTKLELDKIMFVVLRGSLVVHQCSSNYSLSMTLDKCIERLECLPCCMLVYENHCIWSQAVDVIWALFMFGRAVGLIWLSATYSPNYDPSIDLWITPGVQYGLLLPLSIVFALLAILDLISIKVDLGILGRIKRIVYNIIGLLNWPTVIISVEAPILCGLFASMIPIVPAYYFFRGFKLEACCSLHPNNTQIRRELNSIRARIEQMNRQEVPPPSYLEVTAGQEDTRRNVEAYNESLQTQRKVAEENSFPETTRNPFDSESTGNPFSSESIGNPFGLESAGNPFDSEFARNPFDYDFNKIQKY